MFLKNFFYYSRKERTGIFLLLAVLILMISIQSLLSHLESRNQEHALKADSAWLASYRSFSTSLREQTTKFPDYSSPPSQPNRKPEYFTFDPNRADSSAFIRMGLSPFVVRNILRYRSKGGVFRDANALARIYGLSQKEFVLLRPYIRIESTPRKTIQCDLSPEERPAYRESKYPAGMMIDINTADTISLKRIPGIGTFTARRIVTYRNQLGGFYSLSQLMEIRQFPDSLTKWFRIDNLPSRTLHINRFSVERLASHPYLNFYQARAIVEYRRKHGRLHSLKQLSLYEEFKPSDLERLEPYASFE